MGRIFFIIIFSILIAGVIGLFYFKINPLGNNSTYLFLLLISLIVVTGLRRKKLGMSFISKYGFFSKERYEEFIAMFVKKE